MLEVAVGCTNLLWAKCCSDIPAAWNIPHVSPMGFVSSPIATTRLYRPWWTMHGKHVDCNYQCLEVSCALSGPVTLGKNSTDFRPPTWNMSLTTWLWCTVIACCLWIVWHQAVLWGFSQKEEKEETFLHRLLPLWHGAFSQVCEGASMVYAGIAGQRHPSICWKRFHFRSWRAIAQSPCLELAWGI